MLSDDGCAAAPAGQKILQTHPHTQKRNNRTGGAEAGRLQVAERRARLVPQRLAQERRHRDAGRVEVRRQHDAPAVGLGDEVLQERRRVAEAARRDDGRVGDEAVAPVEAEAVLAGAFFCFVCAVSCAVG